MKTVFTHILKEKFYSLLIKILLPIWLLWQAVWHLAFNYWIDYQIVDIGLLVTVKLLTESAFFAVSTFLLFRKMNQMTIVKVLVLVAMLLVLVLTLRPLLYQSLLN